MKNMKMWSPNHLFLSAFTLAFTFVGLWAVSAPYVTQGSASVLLQITAACSILFLGCQIFWSLKASERFVYRLIYMTSLGINILWFSLSLTLPIYISNSLPLNSKLFFGAFFVTIATYHIKRSINDFNSSFDGKKEAVLKRMINRRKNFTNWDGIDKINKTEFKIYLPYPLKKWDWVIYILLFVSMIGGFTFKRIFPVASLIAWSIPLLLVASCIIGMISYRILQIKKIRDIELKIGS